MYRIIIFSLAFIVGLTSFGCKGSLSSLKRDLKRAQKELHETQARIKQLQEAIAFQEIERIKGEIEKIEPKQLAQTLLTHEQCMNFFSEQREKLVTIIHCHPGCAARAQELLDQILTLITQISDEVSD